MSRLSPSWRHTCLLITGTLLITSCGGDSAPSDAALAKSQGHSLNQGADLVITELRAPESVRDGEAFTVNVKVCNPGSAPAYPNGGPLMLQVYLSTTATQQVPAPGAPPTSQQITVGEVDVGPVDAQQCLTRAVSASAIRPPGAPPATAYYLGASVDTSQRVQELNETNNGFVRGLMGVGNGPDLVVSDVKAPASARQGEAFLVDVRVCNVGTASAPSSRVGLYVSTQAPLSVPPPGAPPPTLAPAGDAFVPPLDAGGCVLVQTQAFAQLPPAATTPGQPLYLGAIADPDLSITELREDNNTRVAGRLGIGSLPDLVITEVKGPANVRPGDPISASVTVCNVGTTLAADVRAEVLLSTQATVSPTPNPSPTESPVGQAQGRALDAGRCVTLPVQGFAYPPPASPPDAPLFLAARVDGMLNVPELREDNNTFVKGLVGVGYGPDLVIQSLKAPANVGQSSPFTVEAKVCNVGTGPQNNTAHLELFLSTENPVTAPPRNGPLATRTQVPVGGAEVSYLNASQCQTLSVTTYAQTPADALPNQPLFLGAAVDTFGNVSELREDNNAFTLGVLGVGSAPDLVVTDVRTAANLRDGQPFTATFTVCNQGLGTAYAYGLSLFLSADAAPPVSRPAPFPPPYTNFLPGYALQGRALSNGALAPGQCTPQRATFNALRPPDAGSMPIPRPLNLSAVVDYQGTEQRLDNNGFAVGLVGVGNGPDLVVSELRGPASARPGESITSTVKVCNVGTQPSNTSTRVALYLSTDTPLQGPNPLGGPILPNGSQQLVSEADVPSLSVGACFTRDLLGPASPPPNALPSQPLYLGASVDPGATLQELREDNNTLVAGILSVGNGPDLVITALEAPGTVAPWEPFAASVRVCNVGTEASTSSEAAVIVSTEETWTLPPPGGPMPFPSPPQFLAGMLNVAPIQAGQCTSVLGMMSVSTLPGTSPEQPVYLSAVVDPFQNRAELREDNNVFLRGRLGVGFAADLVITSVTPPASISASRPFTVTVTVCNQGAQDTMSGPRVTLHLLTGSSLSLPPQGAPPVPPGEFLGEASLPPLGAHACVSAPVTGSFSGYVQTGPEQQTYSVGASVDRTWSIQEVRKDNNTFVGPRVGVGEGPDLVITALGGPANVQPGAQMQVPVTVCNQGTQSSDSRVVDFFLSLEPTLPEPAFPGDSLPPSPSQALLGFVEIPPLPQSACATREGSVSAVMPPGAPPDAALFLGAAVRRGSFSAELREDNNTFVRGRIGVGYAPDLIITEVTAPFSVRGGDSFSTTVKVCNQGTADTGPNGGRLELFLSTQPVLEFPGAGPMSSNQVILGGLDVGSLPAQHCTTRQLITTAQTPASAPGSGLFYIGALVDSRRGVMELREDNNAFVQGFLAVLP
ncbi:CARDB domain-containing protein [Corallococcus silvisoli]|uniref:CARDB domain-containing protein n=1 Tax=Corallococcus silvisoli TaxID=2697031 RepID=UPI0013788C6B|nr:CARDB domain-containing protein [Corallococcus silvisoli]NBD14005.1 hypothetical protein [Corallococcus silvisoli]